MEGIDLSNLCVEEALWGQHAEAVVRFLVEEYDPVVMPPLVVAPCGDGTFSVIAWDVHTFPDADHMTKAQAEWVMASLVPNRGDEEEPYHWPTLLEAVAGDAAAVAHADQLEAWLARDGEE